MTDRFAFHYAPDGYSTPAAHLMGHRAADAGLLRAAASAPGLAAVGCFAGGRAHADEGERLLRDLGFAGQVEWIAQDRPQELARFGTLFHPTQAIERLAWRRLGIGERRYSLCGIAHATAGHAAMTNLAGLLVAPVRSWDAVICTSRVVRDTVRRVLERQAEYLGARLGAQRFELPQLPLIPLGVHAADFDADAARRAGARRHWGIDDGDIAFLCRAEPSVHAAAHPQQMLAALGKLAQDGRRVHLVLCGVASDAAGKALREAAAQLCPAVRLCFVDDDAAADRTSTQAVARTDTRTDALAAADIFLSLADNVQESFGLGALEAMAAGLPCIVSDWNGYRDTVRDGVDGYRIPTVMPGAGAGLDLAQRHDDGADSHDLYSAHVSQAVALDGTALAQACARLADDAALRRTLGANGRQHVRAEFDWPVVFGRYRALWRELDERRRADAALGPALPAAVPDRLDPFDAFATYPSRQITPASTVELAPDASLALLRQYRDLAINRVAHASLPTLEAFGQIFGSIESRPTQVDELLDALGPCDRPTLLRGLAWLCKMDLLRIRAADE